MMNIAFPRTISSLKPYRAPATAVRFQGLAPQDQVLEKALLDAGINKDYLKKNFGVTLWTMIAGKNKVFLYVDAKANPDVDLDKLEKVFEKALSGFGEIKLKVQKQKHCCQGNCRGCVATPRASNRDTWIG